MYSLRSWSKTASNTVVDTKFKLRQKMTPEKWSMLSVSYYKIFDEIILNSTYNN